jgi:hypothetical protein
MRALIGEALRPFRSLCDLWGEALAKLLVLQIMHCKLHGTMRGIC